MATSPACCGLFPVDDDVVVLRGRRRREYGPRGDWWEEPNGDVIAIWAVAFRGFAGNRFAEAQSVQAVHREIPFALARVGVGVITQITKDREEIGECPMMALHQRPQ